MNIFCDECKKNIATVFLTKISGNEVSKVQLCDDCANRMEETTEAANLIAFLPQILSGLQGMEQEHLVEDVLSAELVTCGFCGTSFTDFQKMGFLGCAFCYEAFGEALEGVLLDFQEATEHIGKIPGKASESAKLRKRLVELERHLERQIADEEYEAAAAARDQIREIEGKLEGKLEMEAESGTE
jgi:protein arginine kinase activator